MNLLKTASAAIIFFSAAAQADVALTQQDLLGVWRIDKESVNADGHDARTGVNTTWNFKNDGTFEGISGDPSDKHARIPESRAVLNYSIENGKLLKQAAAGRSKYETCAAISKEGNSLVLKCPNIYFFMTKQ